MSHKKFNSDAIWLILTGAIIFFATGYIFVNTEDRPSFPGAFIALIACGTSAILFGARLFRKTKPLSSKGSAVWLILTGAIIFVATVYIFVNTENRPIHPGGFACLICCGISILHAGARFFRIARGDSGELMNEHVLPWYASVIIVAAGILIITLQIC
jgi:uncharacterized membrane protein